LEKKDEKVDKAIDLGDDDYCPDDISMQFPYSESEEHETNTHFECHVCENVDKFA
jgi:hypothetical protein